MKTACCIAILPIVGCLGLHAQTSSANGNASTGDQTSVPAPTAYQVMNQGANFKVWQNEDYEQLPGGQVVAHKHQYTELATGLIYQKNGQWMDSKEEIDLQPDGSAIANQGQHQVYFPADISQGEIALTMPDGKILHSQPVGLSYDDGSNTVLIASLTNSTGYILNSNQVIYPNAFCGLRADLRLTYTKSGLEQDVILKQQTPDPALLNLNPETTRLQILTEFFDPPQPTIETTTVSTEAGDSSDDLLDFGAMQMARGRAFMLGSSWPNVEVNKHWVVLDGRQFLVEEVPLVSIAGQLAELPLGMNSVSKTQGLYATSKTHILPKRFSLHASGKHMLKMAQKPATSPAFVLDYQIANSSSTNLTFQSDTTYYISGTLYAYGTNVFEGGTILKFASGTALEIIPHPGFNPGIVANGSVYRPIEFTSKDDNSVGDSVSGSTGSPSGYYGTMLELVGFSSSPTLSGLRVSYAAIGMDCPGVSANVYDVQFVNCECGFQLVGSTVKLRNALFENIQTNFLLQGGCTVDAQNTTFSGAACVGQGATFFEGNYVAMTNCILNNISNITNGFIGLSGGYNGFYQSPMFGGNSMTNTAYPFQTVGAGSFYLTNGCGFSGSGTANIDPVLVTGLAMRTTHPPMVFSNITFSVVTNLSPQASRDTNTAPDLGYHYDPLDYVLGGCTLSSNLTCTAGTALGWFLTTGATYVSGEPYGLCLVTGGNLICTGTATAPVWCAPYNTVQEGGNGNWTGRGYIGGFVLDGSTTNSQITADFTKWSYLQGMANIWRDNYSYGSASAINSEFYGTITSYRPSLYFTNCLLFRSSIAFWGPGASSYAFQNCTFYNGGMVSTRSSPSFWRVENTAFDGTALQLNDNYNGNTNYAIFNYNAYNSNNLSWETYPPLTPNTNTFGTLEAIGANDLFITNYNWETSWFGGFYVPTNSRLINAGSTTADQLGLYHFTTQTNQMPETNSLVDIGYHYVATDMYGIPISTPGDGIADYLADANGNGLVDPGEIPWTLAIIQQPESTNVVQGQNATFSVLAGGIGLFTYQWLSNNVSITGANNSSFTKLATQLSDAANYSVIVSNATASLTSSNAVLAVTVPPILTTYPISQTVIQGTNVNFTVGVSGNYLAYQWYVGSTPLSDSSRISGSEAGTLTISNVVGSDTANYSVVVTNLFGSVAAGASLTVITNPGIMSWPTNQTVIQSDDVTFTVVASGMGLGYQWWATNGFETNSITGANESAYTKLVAQTNDAGWYSVIITNEAGATNVSAFLNVLVPPWISQQPSSVTVAQGANATFSVTASGTTNLTYQWLKNGTNLISWATNASVTLTNVQASDAAGYSLLASNIAGTNTSAWAWLNVNLTGGGTTNGWGNGGSPPALGPTVSMIGPTNASPIYPAVYQWGPAISIQASASSQQSYITNVAFYFTGTNFGTNFMLAGTAVPGANGKFALAWTNSLRGTNILKARAWDCNGSTNDSQLAYVIMAVPPTISAGTDQTVVWTEGASGTNISLNGTVSNDGYPFSLVTNVQWSVVSGNAAFASFSNLNSLTPTVNFTTNGVFQLQLRVDNNFATNFADCTITIKRHPQLFFNFPTNGTVFLLGTPWVLNATAYPWDGTITNVTFYSGTNLATIGSGIQSVDNTYTYAWYEAPVWTNLISVVAQDNDGLMSTAAVTVAVLPPLAVKFVSPTSGQLFVSSPTNIQLDAQAVSYVGSSVTSLVFSNQSGFLGAGSLATNSLYQFLWQDVTNGVYSVTVYATDNAGNLATNQISITVNAMPVVSIISPTNVQPFSEVTNITLTARAYDLEDGTNVSVGFYYTNALIGWATNIPNTNLFSLVWSNLYTGFYPVVAIATDTRGASTTSGITVFEVTPTNPPPLVVVTYPTNSSVFAPGSDITITASATNWPASVTNVEFFVNGVSIGSDSTAPYSVTECCWDPGSYTIVAQATDNLGMSTVSTNVQITILPNLPTPAEGFWDQDYAKATAFLNNDGSIWPSAIGVDAEGNICVSDGEQGSRMAYITTNLEFIQFGENGDWGPAAQNGTNLYSGVSEGDFNEVMEFSGTNWNFIGDTVNDAGGPSDLFQPINDANAFAFLGGDVYMAGNFITANAQYIAKLDTVSNIWVPVAAPLNGPVYALAVLQGKLIIGGSFTNAGGNPSASYIAELDGTNWIALGTGVAMGADMSNLTASVAAEGSYAQGAVSTLSVCGSNLFVGGTFSIAGSDTNANGIAIWNGQKWRTLNGGAGPSMGPSYSEYGALIPIVNAVAAHGNRVFVGGQFQYVLQGTNALPAANIACATWNEEQQEWVWSDLDTGVSDADSFNANYDSVYYLAIREGFQPDQYDLVVNGVFSYAGHNQLIASGHALWRVGYPQPPTTPNVTVSTPVSSTVFTNPATITLVGLATSSYTNIAQVNFYTNNVQVGMPLGSVGSNIVTFTNLWNSPLPGVYTLTAMAKDVSGYLGESKPVVIAVKSATNPITAINDQYSIPENSPMVVLNLLTNDFPASGLQISQITQLYHDLGIVSIGHGGNYCFYTPLPNVYGNDIFYYTVTNAAGAVDVASVTVNVIAPPTVIISSPFNGSITNALSNVSFNAYASDVNGVITNLAVYLNGGFLGQTNTNSITFNWSTNAPAFYTFTATAIDNAGNTGYSVPTTIAITNVSTATNVLTASIDNLPATDAGLGMINYTVVTAGLFDLKGQARDSHVGEAVAYQVLLHPQGDPDTVIANVTPQPLDANGFHQGGDVVGDLGTNDFTTVPNGIYDLQLIVHGGGGQASQTATFQLQSQLKIGQFSFSQQDMMLPVNGVPITITRTYNSLNPLSSDFGYSWNFAINSMDVQLDETRQDVTLGTDQAPLGDGDGDGNGLPSTVSVRTGGGRDVTLTLPDGRQATFQFYFETAGFDNNAEWRAPPGVNYTLTAIGNPFYVDLFTYQNWNNQANTTFDSYDVPGWILTSLPDQTQYYITRGPGNNVVMQDPENEGNYINVQAYGPPGLSKIVQRTGDTIVINSNSIYHQDTNGTTRAVSLIRDGAGRIVSISDPNAGTNGFPTVQYVYNQTTGNLIWVEHLVDAVAGTYQTNQYFYDNPQFPHYITSIVNADGTQVAKNFYDDSGRLIASQDADGNLTQFIHNLTNNMDVIIDRLGHTNTYVYDLNGNIISQTNQLGQITHMAYDANNNKTNEITYLGNQPYATNGSFYSANNLLLVSTDPLGHTTAFAYDNNGDLLTNVDAMGNTTVNVYDPNGDLIQTTDALGTNTYSSYSGGLLTGSQDGIGTVTTNYYDGSQNLIATATLDTSSTVLSSNSFTYDLNGNRTSSTVWRQMGGSWLGATTASIYDAMNRLVQTVNPDGGTNTIIYDPTGKQQATIDALGRTTSYTYDGQGRLIQTIYPDNTSESSAYDANGNRTNSVDRNGNPTTYVYDALNRLVETIFADGTTNATVYDGVGRTAQTIDALGHVTAFCYDTAGRQLAVTNALQVISSYTYDADGNQILFTDANNHTTTNVFDALNRQVQVLYPDGTTSETVYDADGRSVAQTNQDNVVMLFGYDGAGRLVSVTNAMGQTTRYQYDKADNQVAQIDALNRTNIYVYDGMGRRIQHSLPGAQTEEFSYDLAGNQILTTNFNGAVITNRYDALNRLTNVTSANGYQMSYTYSATGQRLTMTDASGTTQYGYDQRDRLTLKTVAWTNGPTISLNYRYDANGAVSNLWSSSAGGVNLVYNYDPLSRLTNVLANGSLAASQTFDLAGNLQSLRYGNGVTNVYQYDAMNRLTNNVWKTGGTGIASFAYTLGLTGNRKTLTETNHGINRNYTWQYDTLYRLTNETVSGTAPVGTLAYSYDAVGNRTVRTNAAGSLGLANQTAAFNTNDWLQTDAYDNNGNTLSSTNGSVQGPYGYDVMNRLTNYNNSVYPGYNGDGNRVKKTVGSTTTYYLVDDLNPSGYEQVLEEWTVIGTATNLSRVYNYGLNLISQQVPGSSTNYFIYDGHGSTRMLMDASGNFVNAFMYDAYGTLIASNGTAQTTYLYSGQQFDPDIGLYYNRARYLNPNTGRFWTMDTYEGNNEDSLSLHKYLYAADDPVDNVDPSGHDITEAIDTIELQSVIVTDLLPPASNPAILNPVASAKLEKLGINFGNDGFTWDVIGDVKRSPRSRYWVVQYQKCEVSKNGTQMLKAATGGPLDGKWHIDDSPYMGDNDLKDGTIGLTLPMFGVDDIIDDDDQLRYLDMPGYEHGLHQGDTFSVDMRLKIIVYDSASTPPKEVKRSNTLHLKATGTWPNIKYNGL